MAIPAPTISLPNIETNIKIFSSSMISKTKNAPCPIAWIIKPHMRNFFFMPFAFIYLPTNKEAINKPIECAAKIIPVIDSTIPNSSSAYYGKKELIIVLFELEINRP